MDVLMRWYLWGYPFDLSLIFSTDGRMTVAWKNNVALAHPYHEEKWYSKFGWILPSGLGGDSVMDGWWMHRQMDAWKNSVALAQPYHEGKWWQVWLNSAQWFMGEIEWWTCWRMMDAQKDGWMHGKIVLLSHDLTMRGSDVASLVEFRPVV